jgi:hypothetical protein
MFTPSFDVPMNVPSPSVTIGGVAYRVGTAKTVAVAAQRATSFARRNAMTGRGTNECREKLIGITRGYKYVRCCPALDLGPSRLPYSIDLRPQSALDLGENGAYNGQRYGHLELEIVYFIRGEANKVALDDT